VLCVLALAGCFDVRTGSTVESGPIASPDLENGGTISGRVAFEGTPPTPKTIDMSANPQCERTHRDRPVQTEDVVVNSNGTLRNVFVWVKAGLSPRRWAVPTAPVVLDQQYCMYHPRVIGAMAGQNIQILNTDPVNHNIHPMPETNEEWNDMQSAGEGPKLRSFARQEVMVPVKCNVHPWMRAYIGVVAHPFFAVTGDDGSFTIKGLPPGTYSIQTWHEKYGTREQQVTVGSRESKSVDFSYKG
jgi:plastocyanin